MSKYVSRILNYIGWALLAFLIAFVYTRIILGAKPDPSTGLMKVLDFIYKYAFVYMGAIIGSIIATLYILVDVLYLSKRLKNTAHSTIIRLLIVITISIIVGTTHYMLERVVDII